ncbi:MAG: DHH family phosphoesterase [Desulfovibrio sp.]|jgi:phosphoesterase RecJ-like protein|nr:DHH family phosphoesterase [Desulfovibrio sp.]
MRIIQDSLNEAISRAERALVATHVNPDGDAVGSAAALAHIALRRGADVRILLGEGLPTAFAWLSLPAPCVQSLRELGAWTPDLLLLADCGDISRTEPDLRIKLKARGLPDGDWQGITFVTIDHHLSNGGFGDLNWVEASRSSTGELVGLLAEHMGIPLTGDLAEAVYLALVSDTGNFSFANTSSDTLALAARLAAGGFDIATFTAKYENTWNIAKMRLWGRLMTEIRLHADGAVACSLIPKRYLDESGLTRADLDGFASWLRRLRGVRVGLLVREDSPSRCKISLRSVGDVNVNAIAALYGGGGHAAAAGAELALPPEAAAKKVLTDIAARL